MTTYERIEFSERARRVFAPGAACSAAVKRAAIQLAERLGCSWGRAIELMKGRALPTVREMDLIRTLDGAWCPQERKAKPPIMERVHDKIEDIWETIQKFKPIADRMEKRRVKREARLSMKSLPERLYDRA
jgi:hypothetical protein